MVEAVEQQPPQSAPEATEASAPDAPQFDAYASEQTQQVPVIKKFSSSQPSKPKRFYRKTKINTARHKFLNSFFNNEQLTDILKWHNDRPVGEQRRFLHVCDAFYSAHQQEKNGNKSQEEIAALPVSEKMTPFQRQTDDKDHYKKPAQLAPIDIFLSQRRYLKKKRNDEDENTLETWMESCAGSLMEASSVGSTLTDVSNMTSTAPPSCASIPTCEYYKDFRQHNRGFAVNRRRWKPIKMNEAQGNGYALDGFKTDRRFETTYNRDHGNNPAKTGCEEGLIKLMVAPEHQDSAKEFLKNAPPSQKETYAAVMRSMLAHQESNHYETQHDRDFNLERDTRNYNPKRPSPFVKNLYASKVPLGTLKENRRAYLLKNKGKDVKDDIQIAYRLPVSPKTYHYEVSARSGSVCESLDSVGHIPTDRVAGLNKQWLDRLGERPSTAPDDLAATKKISSARSSDSSVSSILSSSCASSSVSSSLSSRSSVSKASSIKHPKGSTVPGDVPNLQLPTIKEEEEEE